MAIAQLSRLPIDPDITDEELTDEKLTDEKLTDKYLLRLPNPPGGKWEVVDGKWQQPTKHDQTVL